jgi:signal transduction histidine kinase
VDRHGGQIAVANRVEGGARFVVSLPAAGGAQA